MSDAYAATGTLLAIGDGVTPVEGFTTIAEVRDISGPALASAVASTTPQEATGGFATKLPGAIDPGDVTFKLNFLPDEDTHDASTGLIADQIARTKRNFEVTFTDHPTTPTVWSFAAFVTGFNIGAPVEGELTADVTLSITGKPDFDEA